MDLYMGGVTTQVSEPRSNTASTTDLKKNLDTSGSAPSLLSILIILFHNDIARDSFLTTSGQSSSHRLYER